VYIQTDAIDRNYIPRYFAGGQIYIFWL